MTENISAELLAQKKKQLEENYKDVRFRMEEAALRAGRTPGEVTLLAATKTVAPELINHAVSLGVTQLGENRVQELCEKLGRLDTAHAQLHLIGHLQTNKVHQIVDKVSMIQSVDSLHLAEEISRVCAARHIHMPVLVEVNIGGEESKAGIQAENAEELCRKIAQLPAVSVCGMLAIPPICENETEIRRYFAQMRKLFLDIRAKKIDNIDMTCLSMGMSGDFPAAIQEGATMIRVGSALFGQRSYPEKK